MFESVMADPRLRVELIAADFADEVASLIQETFKDASISQAEIAQILGVSEARVTQIKQTDGNLYVATLAKTLAALGYSLELRARPAEWAQMVANDLPLTSACVDRSGLVPITSSPRAARRSPSKSKQWVQKFISSEGVDELSYGFVHARGHDVQPVGEPRQADSMASIARTYGRPQPSAGVSEPGRTALRELTPQ
ncbi:XRE family transcriptional regulator [Ornithinimicrobium sp. CNJ-824]|uniref:XRE family transcriptional regulator n=1 Tax=Ornithinimicrobium sp. CNJ-824 TaxID=1904966 RepID=UPI00096A6CF3|nr:XRE family transcriptional regulator [Ornithinimicrobium sp. CNJ-824]